MGEKNLVIVESPAKAKTIEKFLGKGYTVESSFGHICDLAKKNLLETSEGDKLLYSKLDIDLENLGDLIKLPENKLNDDKMVGMLCVFKFFKPFLERSINSVHCQETIRAKINDLSNEFQNMENMYKIDEE